MDEYEDEFVLMDYLNVLWKRKWLVIIPTFFLVIAVGIISFLLPPKWEIDAIIVPSKFLVQTEGGQFEEIVIVNPKQMAGQINEATYNNLIATELNLDIRKFPKLKAENLRDTNLVRVSTKENDTEKAKLILFSLFNHLKGQLDEKVDIEIKGIDSDIKSKEIEKLRIGGEIKGNKNKFNIVKQRKKDIEREMNDTRKRIEALEKEQRLSLKRENRSESESLAMLLYSNEIQQSLEYHNTLNELLSEKKIEEENINLGIEKREEGIKQLENKIDNLNERKGRIDYTQLIKEPTSSLYPVSPKKKLNVMIAGILGLMIFTMLAFFLEYIEKQKAKSK
ncbi:hypothetical protein ES705_47407 [subsurface metagenome]